MKQYVQQIDTLRSQRRFGTKNPTAFSAGTPNKKYKPKKTVAKKIVIL
jgi:hypothetical protein